MTNRTIFSDFLPKNWQKYTKEARFIAIADEHLETENVVFVENRNFGDFTSLNVFWNILPFLQNGEYIFIQKDLDVDVLWNVSEMAFLVHAEPNLNEMLSTVVSIDNRVKFGNIIREKSLCSCAISGTAVSWKSFIGFFNNLLASGMLEDGKAALGVAVNLYAHYYKDLTSIRQVVH